jgi:hypothetical protein
MFLTRYTKHTHSLISWDVVLQHAAIQRCSAHTLASYHVLLTSYLELATIKMTTMLSYAACCVNKITPKADRMRTTVSLYRIVQYIAVLKQHKRALNKLNTELH